MKQKLMLMGIWNILPIEGWEWHSWDMVRHFQKLTGFQIRYFINLQGELSRQSLVLSDTEKLRKYFDGLSDRAKEKFSNVLVKEIHAWARKEDHFLKSLEGKNFCAASTHELEAMLRQWIDILPRPAMPVWFALLIDQWYPSSSEFPIMKKNLGQARDRIGKLHDRSRKVSWVLLGEVGRRTGVQADLVERTTPLEMLALLQGKVQSIPNISARKKQVVFDSLTGRERISVGRAAKKLAATYDPQPKFRTSVQRELTGAPASPGRVKGKVRVIILDREFHTFKKGEILVTIQTMVHFLPLMKKSAAILTEYGGLTSHAAIVSRELKKPCIVGIPFLTNTLKTGDMIEVDATHGIVKKI